MDFEKIIAIYEAIAKLTDDMLAAAKIEDWDTLTALEADCRDQVELLAVNNNILPLSKSFNERRVLIINHILSNDREIRNLVSPKMASLSALISSSQTGKKLNHTYGK